MKKIMGISCVVLLIVGIAGGMVWLGIASGHFCETLISLGIAVAIIGLIIGAVWGLK